MDFKLSIQLTKENVNKKLFYEDDYTFGPNGMVLQKFMFDNSPQIQCY